MVPLISLLIVLAGIATAESPEVFQLGHVIPKVVCGSNPQQTYALYLPTSYRKDKKFPVLFIFEPAARGPLPVNIMQQAAEKFGYILVSSNNSRNGPLPPQLEAAEAMWSDALTRFSIDPKRMYLAGFSGGARVAIAFATSCKGCIAGVAASGAGFPTGLEPKHSKYFALFAAIGREDFNFPEILDLEPKLKNAQFTYRIRRFDGVHQWAPSEVWFEAFDWFNLQAMKAGALPRDELAVAESYRHAMAAAAELESHHEDYEAFRAYRQAVADFEGLTDVVDARRHATELERAKTVKQAAKREREEADQQIQMTTPIWTRIDTLAKDPRQQQSLMRELHDLFDELRGRAKNKKDSFQIVAQRALTEEYVHAYESGSHFIDSKDYRTAIVVYDVIVKNAKQAPAAHLQKARAYAGMGDKKQALAEIQASITDGLIDVANLDEAEFASLKNSPEFKSIIASIRPSKSE